MARELDIQPVAKELRQGCATRLRKTALPGQQCGVQWATWPAAQGDQSVGFALKPDALDVGAVIGRGFEKCARVEPNKIAIARFARGQKNDARALHPRTVAVSARALLIGKVDG